MDITELSEINRDLVKAHGFASEFLDAKYKLYYDETDNVKKFRFDENGFNVKADSIFVLGGIEGDGEVTLDELKKIVGIRQPNIIEIKSAHIYSGTFEQILKSQRLENIVEFVLYKKWHIHFHTLNFLYYSIVDIIDSAISSLSLNLLPNDVFGVKAILYRVAKSNIHLLLSIFNRYEYPNLDNTSINGFYTDMSNMCGAYLTKCPTKLIPYLRLLITILKRASLADSAVFIQDEEPRELVSSLVMDYITELAVFVNSEFIFDNEADIISNIDRDMFVNGSRMTNYQFVDSKTSTLIQLSDIFVGVIARYHKFIDYYGDGCEEIINSFDENQLRRFKKLNALLCR